VESRFVPDVSGAWLVYDLGSLVLSIPPEYRAAADAVAAGSHAGVAEVLEALGSSGIAVARIAVPGGEWTLTFAARAGDPASIPASPVPVPASAPVVPPVPTASVPPPADPTPEITEIPEAEQSAPPAAPAPAASMGIAEHDGHTVLASDLPRPAGDTQDDDKTVVVDEIAALRARRTESAGLAAPTVGAPSPLAAVPSTPRLSLELPDGSREPLDAVILIGRAPTPPADSATTRLVRLDGDGDISRNHARVAVEGDTVVVTDLGSRNGTVVRIPGRSAQKLRDGEPTPVLVGTIIDFGGGVELSVREG